MRAHDALDVLAHEEPSAGIAGLFLTPDDVGGVGIRGQHLSHTLRVERIDLLQTDNGNVGTTNVLTFLHEFRRDLACTDDDALDRRAVGDGCIVDDLLVGAMSDLGKR